MEAEPCDGAGVHCVRGAEPGGRGEGGMAGGRPQPSLRARHPRPRPRQQVPYPRPRLVRSRRSPPQDPARSLPDRLRAHHRRRVVGVRRDSGGCGRDLFWVFHHLLSGR